MIPSLRVRFRTRPTLQQRIARLERELGIGTGFHQKGESEVERFERQMSCTHEFLEVISYGQMPSALCSRCGFQANYKYKSSDV